jgi:uncharacterized protein (DUF1778 family)
MQILNEAVLLRLQNGTKKLIEQASEQHQVSASEYMRAAIIDRLAADGVQLPWTIGQRRLRLSNRKPTP